MVLPNFKLNIKLVARKPEATDCKARNEIRIHDLKMLELT